MNASVIVYWLTVGTYFITAIVFAFCALRSKRKAIWWGLALGMFLLTINKQQDLLGLLTNFARSAAWRADWYMARGSIQILSITGAAVLLFLLFASVLWFLRPLPRMTWLALIGFVFLLGFSITRSVSLHAIDVLLFTPVAGVYLNWVVELGGIALIASVGFMTLWRVQSQTRTTAVV